MATSPAVATPAPRSEAVAALKVSGSVGLAIFPIGIAFGVLVVHSGLAWWWASVFSGVISAGSFEFLLIGLTVAVAPLAQIGLTAFLVNSRHVFYALSFPLHQVRGKAGKVYSTFALTDEAYALTAWGLRALPFTALAPLRTSAAVGYLSARMPLGVMVILIAYTLRALSPADPVRALPDTIALTVTIGLHLWRRNAVLSILGGTAIHAALASTLFTG